ncbi:MAG TPA: phytanoyl-CoA dioxygenase family protein [Planctomycetota bacterium]|nr:phytanoyl-CoA dioxygenase family protein [Planctomycetota bacterium]
MLAEAAVQLPTLYSCGFKLDGEPEHLGLLRDSSAIVHDAEALQGRMAEDGYLFLPGALNRDDVLAARHAITSRMFADGVMHPDRPHEEGVVRPGAGGHFRPDWAKNPAVQRALYAGPMMEIFTRLLGGAVRHYDYTWLRTVGPGHGTTSHCDVVYMGRGTHNLYTAWTPMGDISFDLGGLMILENSHRNQRLRDTYCKKDVDTYCTNKPGVNGWSSPFGGNLTGNANQIRRSVGRGGRWLTTEYKAGDVLIFSIFTIHASLDNRSVDRFRISTDSRYQLASEPVDERWVGETIIAHGPAGKRGRIC